MIGIRATIWEVQEGRSVLTLTHVFWGATLRRALEVEDAHRSTDEFYRGAVEDGEWNGIELGVVHAFVNEDFIVKARSVDLEELRQRIL